MRQGPRWPAPAATSTRSLHVTSGLAESLRGLGDLVHAIAARPRTDQPVAIVRIAVPAYSPARRAQRWIRTRERGDCRRHPDGAIVPGSRGLDTRAVRWGHVALGFVLV